ncbi:MAG: glycosyltransferase family 2 protein [Verrucomicrobiota bacterium]|jgi:glycosyltransferase involved in cell wall biosynthesis
MKISALIHTRNEEANLPDCLRSLAWTDERVVADMASTDRTRVIAKDLGGRVIDVPLAPIVEHVRNQAIEQCRGDWILVLDADERASEKLEARLRLLAGSSSAAAIALPRKNYFLGVWLEHGCWPDYQIRFFRKGAVRWSGLVHEHPEVKGELVHLPLNAQEAIEHTGYATDVGAFMEKLARYSRLDGERLAATTRPGIWPFLLRRPLGEFYGRYFAEQAWRHGFHGLVWSLIQAMYQLQVAIHYWALQGKAAAVPEPAALRRSVRWEGLRSNCKWFKP